MIFLHKSLIEFIPIFLNFLCATAIIIPSCVFLFNFELGKYYMLLIFIAICPWVK